jgi:hypothetical protein
MEILTFKFNPKNTWNEASSTGKQNSQGITGRLIGFFMLSKEERLRAGIYIGNEGREWVEQSALVIFPRD